MFASAAERDEHFRSVVAPHPTYSFEIRDEWDNGEFLTGATAVLMIRGQVVEATPFVASSEDAPGPGFSSYGNGLDNHAGTLARSYAWAWLESMETPLEERLHEFVLAEVTS